MSNYNQSSQYIAGVPQQAYNTNTNYNQRTEYVPGVPQQKNFSENPLITNYNPGKPYPVSSCTSVGFNVPYGAPSPAQGNVYGGSNVPICGYPSPNMPIGGYPPPDMHGVGYISPNMPAGCYTSSNVPGGGYPSSNMPSGGYPSSNIPSGSYPSSNMPSGGYPPSNIPSGGYPSSNIPSGGYPLSSVPGGGYPSPNIPGEIYPSSNMYSGGYPLSNMPLGVYQNANGYQTSQTPNVGYSSVPSAPLLSDTVNDAAYATSYSGQMADLQSKDSSSKKSTVLPQPTPRKSVKDTLPNNDKTVEYQKGLDKLAALMNDDVGLTESKLREDRTKYDLNKS